MIRSTLPWTKSFWRLVVLVGLTTSAFGANQSRPTLEVIPQPREIKFTGAAFEPAAAKAISMSDSRADRFAVRLLQEAMRETHGIDANVFPLAQQRTNLHQLWLGLKDRAPGHPALAPSAKNEGYGLAVNQDGVLVAAQSETGLFYGVQTLIQLLDQAHRDQAGIAGMVIIDWPTFDWRGRYFDGSQYLGTIVVTRANLEREIKLMARSKLNFLLVEMYNLAPFQSFPACTDANTLSLADWQSLVELAHGYHVTLVPSLQSFAQIYQVIWNCEAGKPYREETTPGIICPSRPENVVFLQGLYRDLISLFKYSPILGIGCSEVGMQWQQRYCPRCKQRVDKGETLPDIYYKHVRNCVQAVDAAAKAAGRLVRPLMWADEFYCGYNNHRWVGIENIPTNTVMGHWQYWSRYQNLATQNRKDYDGISGLLARGFDVLFVSASFEFNTYLHDLSPAVPADGKWDVMFDSGISNIVDQARWADVYQQKELRGKMWGGGCATFSQHDIRCWDTTWFAYLLQAEYTWSDPTRPLDHTLSGFIERFAAVFYGARDRQTARTIATAWRELDAAKNDIERNNYLIRDILGEYDIHDASYNGNDLEASLKLINGLTANPQGPGKNIEDIRLRSERVLRVAAANRQNLAAGAAKTQNCTSFHYLISAAHKMENHAQRTLLMIDLADAFQRWDSAKNSETRVKLAEVFLSLQKRLETLQGDTRVIADEMDELAYGPASQLIWEGTGTEKLTVAASGDTTGYHKALASLDALSRRVAQVLQTAKQP
jgi:hypothetical protein